MVVTSSAHVERLCLPWMAAVAVPKAPMVVTSSAQVERLCGPWMNAVAGPKKAPAVVTTSAHVERLCGPWMAAVAGPKKAPAVMTTSAQVERLCLPFMEGTKPVDSMGWPTPAYDFEDLELGLGKTYSKAFSTISTDAGDGVTPLTTPSASPFCAGASPLEAPWGFSL